MLDANENFMTITGSEQFSNGVVVGITVAIRYLFLLNEYFHLYAYVFHFLKTC